MKNVREAIERVLERHLPVITAALKPPDPDPKSMADARPADIPGVAMVEEPGPQEFPASPTPASLRREAALAKRLRRVERFEQVHELHRQGTPIRQIARDLAMSRMAVRRSLRHEKCPEWGPRRARRSGMDSHREWIDA